MSTMSRLGAPRAKEIVSGIAAHDGNPPSAMSETAASTTDDPAAGRPRCGWATTPEYVAYHDDEWGVPTHDERELFELLCLEGAQAGLAWITILRKREAFRRAFDGFHPKVVAAYGDAD